MRCPLQRLGDEPLVCHLLPLSTSGGICFGRSNHRRLFESEMDVRRGKPTGEVIGLISHLPSIPYLADRRP
ncbi:hypothetical protein PUN4_550236 [Paraburkholderia unamae]|nr:hypothetical protein PUN4_550236 [Paraburkholderia unamae]